MPLINNSLNSFKSKPKSNPPLLNILNEVAIFDMVSFILSDKVFISLKLSTKSNPAFLTLSYFFGRLSKVSVKSVEI